MAEQEYHTHPHAIMADFINQYEGMIRPGIESGNLIGAQGVIGCQEMDILYVDKSPVHLNVHAYAHYKMALTYLTGFLKIDHLPGKKELKALIRCTNLQVSKLKLILQGDSHYEEHIFKENSN